MENDTNDVLANIVNVALHGGEQDFALGFINIVFAPVFFDERNQIRNRLLHDTRTFNDLRQKHFPGSEQVANDVHTVHQRPFDHFKRPIRRETGLLRIFENEIGHAVDESVGQSIADRRFPPRQILGLFLLLALKGSRGINEAFGRIVAPVQNYIFHQVAEFGGYIVIQC